VRRQGRITQAQRRALETLWPIYGLDPAKPFEPRRVFNRNAPVIVEIGFGNGDTLAQMAMAQPDIDFLGIEVHRPGVGHLLLKLEEQGLTNVRIYCADALEILRDAIPDDSLAGLNLFFPDPWPKQRHHKRRLVNPAFASLVAGKLMKPGGRFHAATDWEDYAHQMMEVLENCGELQNVAGKGGFWQGPTQRPQTRFEGRGKQLGHQVWDLVFARV
jgi:tRNA (guanine-N7-)-methyltransferase